MEYKKAVLEAKKKVAEFILSKFELEDDTDMNKVVLDKIDDLVKDKGSTYYISFSVDYHPNYELVEVLTAIGANRDNYSYRRFSLKTNLQMKISFRSVDVKVSEGHGSDYDTLFSTSISDESTEDMRYGSAIGIILSGVSTGSFRYRELYHNGNPLYKGLQDGLAEYSFWGLKEPVLIYSVGKEVSVFEFAKRYEREESIKDYLSNHKQLMKFNIDELCSFDTFDRGALIELLDY